MAKNNKNAKKEMEMELFDTPEINEEVITADVAVEANEEIMAAEENQEMEMELDGEEIQSEMEELVAEKVKKEEKENKEQKSKRGPKPGNKKDKEPEGEKEAAPKKEKALNLNDMNIVQREIKKGRLSAPQGRIEKTEAGYVMKLADGVIFPEHAKNNYKEVDNITKMNDGKYVLTMTAANNLNTEKFKAVHENGEEVEHDYVRVELHKPGRDKDVIELFTVRAAKDFLNIQNAQNAKKEEEKKKKEEKAKEKAEKEAKEKEEKEENKEAATK